MPQIYALAFTPAPLHTFPHVCQARLLLMQPDAATVEEVLALYDEAVQEAVVPWCQMEALMHYFEFCKGAQVKDRLPAIEHALQTHCQAIDDETPFSLASKAKKVCAAAHPPACMTSFRTLSGS